MTKCEKVQGVFFHKALNITNLSPLHMIHLPLGPFFLGFLANLEILGDPERGRLKTVTSRNESDE